MKRVLPWVVAAAVLAGCATTGPRLALTGDPVVDGPLAIQQGPPQDRTLWQCRMSASMMRRGRYEEAKRILDEILPRIGGIIANDADARRARSLFHGESRKPFIGEPYERVMAYYYRGVLYWMDGELDNARACFRSAQFQDADAEDKTYASDYVLLDYLDGYATAKLGGDGSEELNRARKNAKGSAPPPYHVPANVLVFLEFGQGPRKYADGVHREKLRFREGAPGARSVSLRLAGQQFHLVPYDDLQFQATTRGGRVMDHILAGKAVFKNATSAAGDVALVTGVVLAATDHEEAGAVVAGLGLLSKIVSAATVPAADARCWDNLPRHLSFAALQLPAGSHTFSVDFLGASGQVLVTRTVSFSKSDASKDTVLFVSEMNQ